MTKNGRTAPSTYRRAVHASVLAVVAGCTADPGGGMLTAAERQHFIRAAETDQLRRELRPLRCGLSSELAQVRARETRYRGADAFDSRGCPPGTVDPGIQQER